MSQNPLPFGQQLKSVPVYGVRLVRESVIVYEPLNGPADAATLLMGRIGDHSREVFEVILLDTKNRPIGVHTVSVGILNSSYASVREVFQAAILANAAGMIVGHNHPSGDTKPSMEDIATTRQLIEAGKIIGISILDHIIVANGSYLSMAQDYLLEFPRE